MITMPATVPIFDVGDYEAQIEQAAGRLRDGGIVVLPTETVYGAAGLLSHPKGRERLKALRGGDEAKPFTVHVARREDAMEFLGPVNDLARRMMKKLWPGPVGLSFSVAPERQKEVAAKWKLAESDLYDVANSTITLRCPDDIVAGDILAGVSGPVVLTLATNASRGASLSPQEISEDFSSRVDLVIDAGPTRFSKPSTLVRVHENRYEIVRPGVYDERIIERMLRTTILFVCSGNTCRSPMAEAIARHIIADKLKVGEDELERKGISVISAGAVAMPGARATPQAVEALRDMGVDLTRHRSKPLSIELIHQADVIFGMGIGHTRAVMAMVPSSAEKVTTLNPDGDIDDPIGGDIALYQELAGQLTKMIEKRLERFGSGGFEG